MLSTLRNRIFLLYSLLFLFVVIIGITILSVYISKTLNHQITAGQIAYSENIGALLEDKFRQMDRISTRVLFSQAIMDTISGIMTEYDGYQNYFDRNRERLNGMLRNFLVILGLDTSNTIINIYNEKAFITTAPNSTNWNIIKKDATEGVLTYIQTALNERANSPLLIGPHKAFWTNENTFEYFSLSRRLYDLPTGRYLGILQILKQRTEIENLCESPDDKIQIFLFNRERKIINTSGGKSNLELAAEKILNHSETNFPNGIIKNKSEKNYLASIHNIKGFDYGILVIQYYHSNLLWFYIGILLVFVLFITMPAICFNYLISRYLTKPLEQIITTLHQITWDNLESHINLNPSTEDMRELQYIYNEMLVRIREAMNQTVQSQLNEREAYYLALQSQISPHFFYNCISNINAIAYENNISEINDICEFISNMLRYAMKLEPENSTIKQELEYTYNYLKLMKIRYADEFIFSVNMEEACGGYPIPRLMLQTVVENCFKHAFSKISFPWLLQINIYSEQNRWIIEVIDNGSGIGNDKTNEIIAKSQKLFDNALQGLNELNLGGLGLINSLTRLRLLYNNNIYFMAKSIYHGTAIRFGGGFGNEQIQSDNS